MSFLPSILIAVLGLVAVHFAGRRSPVLAAITLVTLLLLPLLGFLPKVRLDLPATELLSESPSTGLLAKIYLAGVVLFSLKFFLDFASYLRWRAHSVALSANPTVRELLAEGHARLGLKRAVALRVHPSLTSPVAAGLFRPTIFLPAEASDWSANTFRCVLLHELGHHARRDLWISLAARLACLIHWFNPFAWLLRKQLLTQCEYACDARVLATGGIDAKAYAHTLCDLALPSAKGAPALAMAMATRSTLRSRVENLLSPARPLSSLSISMTLLLTLGTAVALNTLRPLIHESLPGGQWSQQEIDLRHTANPFPGN